MERDSAQYKPILRRIVDLGAKEAKIVSLSTVVTADCPLPCSGLRK